MFLFCRGGEEVLLDVAGQDATEAFEDVGHSDEARQILAGLQVGVLKRNVSQLTLASLRRIFFSDAILQPGDPIPKAQAGTSTASAGGSSTSASSFGVGAYIVLLVGAAAAYFAYQLFQQQQQQ